MRGENFLVGTADLFFKKVANKKIKAMVESHRFYF